MPTIRNYFFIKPMTFDEFPARFNFTSDVVLTSGEIVELCSPTGHSTFYKIENVSPIVAGPEGDNFNYNLNLSPCPRPKTGRNYTRHQFTFYDLIITDYSLFFPF